MADPVIERVRVYTVGPNTKRWTWADDLPEQYVTNTMVRLFASDGTEGFAGAVSATSHMYDCAPAETLRSFVRTLIGRSAFEREAILADLDDKNVIIAPQMRSCIDVALWDLAGKQVGQPIYRMLGGARDKIMSYASTPMLGSPEEYVDYTGELIDMGFKAIKFHCWCVYEKDKALVEAVEKAHGTKGIKLMLDTEQRYDRREASAMAGLLEECGYEWFEAPLPDLDIEGYAELRRGTSVPVLCSGNYILEPSIMNMAVDKGAWSAIRCEPTFAGGITGVQKIFNLASARNMTVELQTWGYSTTQAAGLHLELGHPNALYFEQVVPYDDYEFACKTPIRTDEEGYVHAPRGNGLGIELDWDEIEECSVLLYEDDGKTSTNIKARGIGPV